LHNTAGSVFGAPSGRWFAALAIAQACHSIEEMLTGLYDFFWTATGRFHEWLPAFPRLRMSAPVFGALNMAIIAFLFACVPFVAARRRAALRLAAVAGAVEIANGIGHLAGTLAFSGYVPGAAPAPLLLAAGIGLLAALARQRSLAGSRAPGNSRGGRDRITR
jgi:hypothetical protein